MRLNDQCQRNRERNLLRCFLKSCICRWWKQPYILSEVNMTNKRYKYFSYSLYTHITRDSINKCDVRDILWIIYFRNIPFLVIALLYWVTLSLPRSLSSPTRHFQFYSRISSVKGLFRSSCLHTKLHAINPLYYKGFGINLIIIPLLDFFIKALNDHVLFTNDTTILCAVILSWKIYK